MSSLPNDFLGGFAAETLSPGAIRANRVSSVKTFLTRFRFLTRGQIQTFLFEGVEGSVVSQEVMTQRMLRSMISSGQISRSAYRVGEQPVYYLKTKHKPSKLFVAHSLEIANFHLSLRRQGELSEWFSEGDLQSFKWPVIPDGLFTLKTPGLSRTCFFEMDMGTEPGPRFLEKARGYLRLYANEGYKTLTPIAPMVVVVAPSPTRVKLLRAAVEGADAPRGMFAFAALSDAMQRPLDAVWVLNGKDVYQSVFRREEPRASAT